MKCNFNKEKNLALAYSIYLSSDCNEDVYEPNEQFLQELAECFNDPDNAAKAIEELVGAVVSAPTGSFCVSSFIYDLCFVQEKKIKNIRTKNIVSVFFIILTPV